MLHIGFPKTGTTTLQQRLFRHLAYSAVPGRDDAVLRPLIRWSAHGPGSRVSTQDIMATKDWLAASRMRTRIMSEENIIGLTVGRLRRPQRFRRWSPAQNLISAIEQLETPRSTVHILLTIRSQAELLPALFAQNPPTANFDSWIGSVLAISPGSMENPFDFHAVATAFSDAFGRSNVHVLPLHRIGMSDYFDELCRGTELIPADFLRLWSERGGVENKRRLSTSAWKANEPMRLRGRIAVELKDFPRLRRFLISQLNIPVRALSAASWRPTPRVNVLHSQHRAIVSRFADSNRELSRTFGLDLRDAMYW